MNIVECSSKADKQSFLAFRKELYRREERYVDNFYFMLAEIFDRKIRFARNMKLRPMLVRSEQGEILCEGIIGWHEKLPEYVQLCFFEADTKNGEPLPGVREAARELIAAAEEIGRELHCRRLVVGLNGHVNYGLGLLASHYDKKNSFSSPGNPACYNEIFLQYGCEKIALNSYHVQNLGIHFRKYERILDRLYRNYTFSAFDKKHYDRDAGFYTELNNLCFNKHRYYFRREKEDDREMLKELFLFMKEDSLIYAFKDGKPVGFLLWYPDYNELARVGEVFGTPHFFRNLFHNRKIRTAKLMEYGVLEEYRGTGLPLALLHQAYQRMAKRGIDRVESSWILAENKDSNSFCEALCDGRYKDYAVYEKEL